MLFDWLDEERTPGLTREERFMGVLFDLGMATNDQLVTITQWTPNQIKWIRNSIRTKAKNKNVDQLLDRLINSVKSLVEDKNQATQNQLIWISNGLKSIAKQEEAMDEWIKFYSTYKRHVFAYTLGSQGVRYVADMMGQSSYKELGAGQREHTLGVTEILARLMRAGVKPEQWLSSREASDRMARIQEDWRIERGANGNWEVEKLKKGKTIRPDGAVKINGRWFFLEYDRGTKHGERIRKQIDDYILLAGKVGQIDPIIWVIANKDRVKDLRDRIYPKVMEKYPPEYPAPKMFFFAEGDETKFLMESESLESESLVLPKEQAEDEKLQELKERIRELERQLENEQVEVSRLKRRIEYLTSFIDHNRKEEEKNLAWTKGLIEHLRESKGGFFKSSPEQALIEYTEKQAYPEKLKEAIDNIGERESR